ncbi:MAG: hypothetical protein IJI73_00365, partial [Kiritimatiellae bacterium]|nr:hypothetical protein [Kiritimatiellia bacterium]
EQPEQPQTEQPAAQTEPEPAAVADVRLESLLANPGTATPGEAVTFTFVASDVSAYTYALTRGGETMSSGTLGAAETSFVY